MSIDRTVLVSLLFSLLLCAAHGETYRYEVTALDQKTGTLVVTRRETDGGYSQIFEMNGGIALFLVYSEFSLRADLEYDPWGELTYGKTHSTGPSLDKAFEITREGSRFRLSRSVNGRPWKEREQEDFRATTLFIHNPGFIRSLAPRGSLALFDIEKDKITRVDYSLFSGFREPWGDVWVMEDGEMSSYFDRQSFRLLYSEVSLFGVKVITRLVR